MDEIAITRAGEGPEILLVHGGAGPKTTWGSLAPLAARWTLCTAHRRGYPPSPPPPGGGQDFEFDAQDLLSLLDARPHVLAHSYGVLGALLAAARRPGDVRSLTLIEPPLYAVVEGDPEVARLRRNGDEVLTRGLDADPATLREFLRLAGAPVGEGPLPEEIAAAVPVLVASGDHAPGIERICDALAAELGAERLVLPGAGHFVAAAPRFPAELERFLASVG